MHLSFNTIKVVIFWCKLCMIVKMYHSNPLYIKTHDSESQGEEKAAIIHETKIRYH